MSIAENVDTASTDDDSDKTNIVTCTLCRVLCAVSLNTVSLSGTKVVAMVVGTASVMSGVDTLTGSVTAVDAGVVGAVACNQPRVVKEGKQRASKIKKYEIESPRQ